MKDLFSIKEFSDISGVESTVLRYWDEIGIFCPMNRNPENNYRYYSIVQLLTLNFVTTLSDLGIPLKTIAELRKERDPESILALLSKRERELDMELRTLRLRSSIIHAREDLIMRGLRVDEAQVSVQHMPEMAFVLWPRNEYEEGDAFIDPLAAFINKTEKHHINLCFPVGGYWSSMEAFVKEPARPEHFFSIDPIGTHIQKEGEYLVGFARGYYGEMGDLPKRMTSYTEENSLTFSGPVFTAYLLEEICNQDTSQYLAQTYVAVKKPKRPSAMTRREYEKRTI